MKRSIWSVLVLVAVMATTAATAAAGSQPGSAPAQREAARDEFVPVKDLPAAEQLPAAPLVIGAYAFIWAAALAYLWIIWRRLGAVDRELVALRRAIERRQ